MDYVVKENNNLKIELENERKKLSYTKNTIHNLKMALDYENKVKSSRKG